MLAEHSRVRLLNDGYSSDGAQRGMIGYIVAVFGDGNYEVEFSNTDGITVAQVVVAERDLELCPSE